MTWADYDFVATRHDKAAVRPYFGVGPVVCTRSDAFSRGNPAPTPHDIAQGLGNIYMTTENPDAKMGNNGYAARESESVGIAQPGPSCGEVVLLFPGRTEQRRGCDVDRINQWSFYELGKLFKQLDERRDAVPRADVFFVLLSVRSSLSRLIERGQPVQLGLSRGPAQQLYRHANAVYSDYFTEEKDGKRTTRFPDDSDAPIPEWEWNQLHRELERFETIFQEEMREATTYFVPPRGIYRTTALIDEADKTFPADVIGHIPLKALEEWRGAGRCLAFNLLSASGFHVARAVESVMEAYYQFYSGKPGATLKSWHDYIEKLEKIAATNPTPSPKDKTLAELRQMKDDYRNPIMHPRVVLSEADARMLFSNGESLIIAMAQELGEAAGVQPQLALVQSQTAALPPAKTP